MIISREVYDHLMKLQVMPAAPPAHSSHHAFTSSSSTTLLASSSDYWIIDSGASAHLSSTQSLLTRFSKLSQPSFVCIADGHACSVVGHGEANPTTSLSLSQVLYAPNSPSSSYLSTPSPKHYFASSHSFFTIAPFRICKRGRGLVWGVRLDMDFMSLSPIIFQLVSLVSFLRPILHSTGIDDLVTPVSPNFAKLSHGFLYPPLSVSHDN